MPELTHPVGGRGLGRRKPPGLTHPPRGLAAASSLPVGLKAGPTCPGPPPVPASGPGSGVLRGV